MLDTSFKNCEQAIFIGVLALNLHLVEDGVLLLQVFIAAVLRSV